ncbi:MAG: hypothetical protein CM15mP127_15450 [Gammaproteobacteria bacterium]|nr:MAG: hypothetical protein CM15mP127_15450 [Gammaproteobacteria bacterium]
MASLNEKTIFLSILIFFTSSCKNSSKNQAETGWKLVWQDEFNYSTQELNNNWNFEEGYGQNGWGMMNGKIIPVKMLKFNQKSYHNGYEE